MEAEGCALAGTDYRPTPLRRRAGRPQLKRDPLGRTTTEQVQVQMTQALPPRPSPQTPWLVLSLQIAGVFLAAFAVFRFGALWGMRATAELQPHDTYSFQTTYIRYLVAVLWPLPAGLLLFLSAAAFRHGRKWRWAPVMVAALWLAAYVVIRPSGP